MVSFAVAGLCVFHVFSFISFRPEFVRLYHIALMKFYGERIIGTLKKYQLYLQLSNDSVYLMENIANNQISEPHSI